MFEASSLSPAAPPSSSHMPLFPSHPMRVSDECECAGVDLSEYVVSGRGAPDSSELAEFLKFRCKNLCPVTQPPRVGTDDSQWVRSCVELLGYARGWVPVSSPSHSTMLYTMMQMNMSS